MVDEIRENYNLPILEDDMGVEWQANSDLQGGTLIREVYNYYWTRIDLTSGQNILPPSEDIRHTRFLPFNQGIMQVPESDIQFNRIYGVNLNIDWNKNVLYVNVDDSIPVGSLERFSLFSVIGDDVRLIDYQGHYGGGVIAHTEINIGAKDHPILQNISDFDSYGSLYKNPSLADDSTLLLTGKTEEHTEPVAWTRIHNGGRVFYTSLGHQRDF